MDYVVRTGQLELDLSDRDVSIHDGEYGFDWIYIPVPIH